MFIVNEFFDQIWIFGNNFTVQLEKLQTIKMIIRVDHPFNSGMQRDLHYLLKSENNYINIINIVFIRFVHNAFYDLMHKMR